MAVRGAIEAKAYVIIKMVHMEKNRLENNHGENFIKYKYTKGTSL
jgi:hypothetical protein